jgi:hypothetical protein
MKVDLKIDWCSHKAAKYAVENWHYSKVMPVGKLVKIGAWEDGRFIGCVIFSRGANKNMLKPYGLKQTEGCELTRVSLRDHKTTVSRIIRIALIFLKKSNEKLRLVVSYADTSQGHYGGIYQAGNWIYDNFSKQDAIIINGKQIHRKSLYSKYGHSSVPKLKQMGFNVKRLNDGGKHRYLMPLDKDIKKKVQSLAKKYPKNMRGLVEEQQIPSVDGGATPTSTLQTKKAET